MKQLGAAVGVLLTAACLGSAVEPMKIDFHWSFKQRAAQNLFAKKDYAGAQKALDELTETAPTPAAGADCISLSAIALAYQDQYEAALQKAGTLAEPPMADYTRMEIMTVAGKQAELVAAYKETDFSVWPEKIAYQGFLLRGNAYQKLADNQTAVKDLAQAVEQPGASPTFRVETLNRVGGLYAGLEQPEQALAAYQQAMAIVEDPKQKTKGPSEYPLAIMGAARVLLAQGKPDDAVAMLAKYDPSQSKSYGLRVLETAGDILAGQGNKDAARAKYEDAHKRALGWNDTKAADRVAKKIEALK